MSSFWLAFIPIFVAVDALGVLPIFISLTSDLDRRQKLTVIYHSMVTAICLAVAFIFLGKTVFNILKVTVGDFMIAGGGVLFCIAIIDIINPEKKRYVSMSEMGAVPIGTPLIVGPAVLTTCLIIIDEYGFVPTLVSVLVNVLLAGTVFTFSGFLIKVLGERGSRALSKVMSLFLAAIAVMMMRKGFFYIVSGRI